ncbi:MAG: S16 family serine protease [Candidatus Micrarchaeia archaeon]
MSGLFFNKNRLFFVSVIAFLIFSLTSAYNTSIHVPAVLGNTNTGTISIINLSVTSGNGKISILGPSNVGQSTLNSAETGVAYASSLLNLNESKYNFTYIIYDNFSNVTGPSGGLAFTLLAISGLKQVPLKQNFTLTGTISSNGAVGPIGGITDKVAAAKSYGLNYVLAPAVQNGSFEDTLYYISQQVNNIPIIEVGNVSQAIPYAFVGYTPKITRLSYNASAENYNLNISEAPFSCINSCNQSYFGGLVNYTFGITSNEISSISNNFSTVKSQLNKNLNIYKEIASKGYLYTGADLAFLEYIDAYTFANTNNYTLPKANALLNSVSNYCNSFEPTFITPQNYEYIISGEVRQSWAQQNILTAKSILNQTQSTDNIVEAINVLGESSAWCAATKILYQEANAINQNNNSTVAYGFSKNLQNIVSNDLNNLKTQSIYAGDLYYEAANASYNQGRFGAALYSIYYLKSESNTTQPSNYSESYLVNNLTNISGLWPIEYANSAAFYANEANVSKSNSSSQGYLGASYPLALIAISINKLDSLLANTLVPGVNVSTNSTVSSISSINSSSESSILGLLGEEFQSINTIQQQVKNLQLAMELVIIMVVVLLVALIYSLGKEFSLRREILKKEQQLKNITSKKRR